MVRPRLDLVLTILSTTPVYLPAAIQADSIGHVWQSINLVSFAYRLAGLRPNVGVREVPRSMAEMDRGYGDFTGI